MEGEVTCGRIIEILRKLPEKKFRISELAPQLVKDGRIDIVEAINRQPELNTAILEVQNYIKEVKDLYRVVLRLSLGEKFTSPDELGEDVGDEE